MSSSTPSSPGGLPVSPYFENSTGKPVSFLRLMSIRRHPTDLDTFISATKPFSPMTYAFGGHVYAQAAWAASKTVERGMYVHNISGHFILPGLLDVPFFYHVRRLRSGGMYSLRLVEVYQDQDQDSDPPPSKSSSFFSARSAPISNAKTPCFVATISFKRLEPLSHPSNPSSSPLSPLPSSLPPMPPRGLKFIPFSHQSLNPSYLRDTYPMLYSKPPNSHPYAPGADFEWFTEYAREMRPHPDGTFPGVETRKVDLRVFNEETVTKSGVGQYRMLHIYRLIEPEESPLEVHSSSEKTSTARHDSEEVGSDDDKSEYYDCVNLSVAAHAYASDRNGLFLIARALGFGNGQFRITSLSHAIVFHASPDRLLMQSYITNGKRRRKYFVQEAWSSVSGGNRALIESRLFSFDVDENGEGSGKCEVLATTFQEGMCRLGSKEMRSSAAETEAEKAKL